MIKVLSVFEERITAMKEAVAMDMNEKLDNAGNTVSSTKMLQTGTVSTNQPTSQSVSQSVNRTNE